MGGSDDEVRMLDTMHLWLSDDPSVILVFYCKSLVQVMILGSEEEDEVVTLDESSITSLLAGAGVTITRTTGTSSSAPRTSRPAHVKPTTAMVGRQSSKTTTPIGRQQVRLAPSGQGVAPLSQQIRPAQVFKCTFQSM